MSESVSVVRQLLAAGLLDELQLLVHASVVDPVEAAVISDV
jgi:hypothetical protein